MRAINIKLHLTSAKPFLLTKTLLVFHHNLQSPDGVLDEIFEEVHNLQSLDEEKKKKMDEKPLGGSGKNKKRGTGGAK